MTATKTTKIAALVTAICLMLSSVMMLGKTYAWFTDEAKSGDNIITSGTLDVEMSYAKEIDGTYTNVDDANVDPIFEYDLWEPGYTQVRYVKIANKGNLAFKYNLTLTTDETATTVDGKEVKLSEVIDVYVGTGEVKNRNDLAYMTKVGTLAELMADEDGAAYGIMLPAAGADDVTLNPADAALVVTGEQTYCVVLHMQEKAGNEYQKLSVGSGIDVLLYAEQYTYENDSFDNQYDANAGLPVADVKLLDVSPQDMYIIPDITQGFGGGNNVNIDPDVAFTFVAQDDANTVATNKYKDWLVDYYVSVDQPVEDGLVLVGSYGNWQSGAWYGFSVPTGTDSNGDPIIVPGQFYPLLGTMSTGGISNWTYEDIVTGVGTFNCGAVDMNGLNNGATMTVELRAINPDDTDEYFALQTIKYTFGANTPAKLTAALNNVANGDTIVLADDIALNDAPVALASGVEATLDLNGHTLSGVSTSNTTSNLIKVNSGAKLTIKNGTISFGATTPDTNWGGVGQPAFPGYANNTISNSGTLVIDGATLENKTAPGGASYVIDNYPGANLIINSGTINGYGKTAIRLFANSKTVATNVTVNGGTITGSRAIWIQLPGSDATAVPPVNVTVTGGELTSTNDPADNNYLAIYAYSYGNNANGTNVTISGGTFNGDVAFGAGTKNGAENVTITGGVFNGDVGRYTAGGWVDIAH